jgi:hypothetical protein
LVWQGTMVTGVEASPPSALRTRKRQQDRRSVKGGERRLHELIILEWLAYCQSLTNR